ncbi:MAG: 4-hydroxyphenylacetate catabolism regulatory protein HpaA [Oceanospirillaceae bacterium]
MPNSEKRLSANVAIPNIDITQVYDQHYADEDLHYESLEKLADFFGRNMAVHHHDRFYQLHVVLNGIVRVHLDEVSFNAKGPMFFLTPPTVPHAFIIEEQATGHVITIRQQLIWQLLGEVDQQNWIGFINQPLCVELHAIENNNKASVERLLMLLNLLTQENSTREKAHHMRAMQSLLQLILTDVCRLADKGVTQKNMAKEDIRIFHHFNELIEQHYRQHLSLTHYANHIKITEARLNNVCRRLSGLPSKRLIMDRLVQESRRLLRFSSMSVTEIGYHLGFKDPAYFARFFRRNAGVTASEFRENKNTLPISELY